MSRKVLHRPQQVEVLTRTEERLCDKCGNPLDPAEYTELRRVAHELEIYLDAEQCVSFRFRRDYCPLCLEPIWQAICALIGADPDDCSGSSFEDEEELSHAWRGITA